MRRTTGIARTAQEAGSGTSAYRIKLGSPQKGSKKKVSHCIGIIAATQTKETRDNMLILYIQGTSCPGEDRPGLQGTNVLAMPLLS